MPLLQCLLAVRLSDTPRRAAYTERVYLGCLQQCTVGELALHRGAGITAFPELLVRAFSLRKLPRAEDLAPHDLYSTLAAIAAANVLLLLVTQRGRTLVSTAVARASLR